MKLRIIKKSNVFIPQFFGRSQYNYQNSWKGFGIPNIKFSTQKQAEQFVSLVDNSVPCFRNEDRTEVVFRNFKDEKACE